MSPPLAPVVCLLACLLTAPGPGAPAERASPAARYVAPAAAVRPAAADTLRYQARAGQPFIVGLPARLGTAEATYRPVELPALSWLVDRSFFWDIQPGETGTLPVVFERRVAGSPSDTLVLLVEIAP